MPAMSAGRRPGKCRLVQALRTARYRGLLLVARSAAAEVVPNSATGEGGLALLLEGGDPLAVVVGAGGGALGGGFGGQHLVEGQVAVADAADEVLRQEE